MEDVTIELFLVHDHYCTENGICQFSCMEQVSQLFISEYRTKTVRIDSSIITISPFRVDVPSSSQRVWFHTKSPRVETDNEVEPGEKQFIKTEI